MTEGYTEEEVRVAEKAYKKEEAERLGKQYGLDPAMVELYGGETTEDMEAFSKVVSQNIKGTIERQQQAENPGETTPLTQAEKEKQQIYGEDHYEATPEEIDAFSTEQYRIWKESGAHIKTESEVADSDTQQGRAEEVERLDKMRMGEYAQEMNRRDNLSG